MGQVAVPINGRVYEVACEDGQEDRITGLATYIDEEVGELVRSVGNSGDLRLMVMASLMVADKLMDSQIEVDRLRAQMAQAKQAAAGETDAAVGPIVDSIARRVDGIAAQLEAS